MKIIFLDIDGVLNSEVYFKSVNTKIKGWTRFDPKAVNIVKKLAEEYEAKIVMTTLWRIVFKKELAVELKKSGLVNYLHKDWQTSVTDPPHRGNEIQLWLDNHPEVSDYIVLDDDDDILEKHKHRSVLTEMYEGLTESHYFAARELFENNKI